MPSIRRREFVLRCDGVVVFVVVVFVVFVVVVVFVAVFVFVVVVHIALAATAACSSFLIRFNGASRGKVR